MDYDSALIRFWSKVNKTETCWIWNGAKNNRGYGVFSFLGKPMLAHRFIYLALVGPIPDTMSIDHVWNRDCRSVLCVNPAHLDCVTRGENNHRKTHKRETCSKGHRYNWIYIRKDGRRERRCSTCYHPPYGNYELIR